MIVQIVPTNVVEAIDRMCTPLDASRLSGATAEADARCMAAIRRHVFARREAPSRAQALQWFKVSDAGLPPADQESVYVGTNGNGYFGCFNAVTNLPDKPNCCVYETAEETVVVMSDLTNWARISP